MDKASTEAFELQSQAAFAARDPGSITIDGTSYAGSVRGEPTEFDLNELGIRTLKAITASIDKAVMPVKPEKVLCVWDLPEGDGEAYEIHEVTGDSDATWFIRAAQFPNQ